jgi:hypothetical protein
MTMQVGMVASDGLVVVGDTKQFKEPQDGGFRSSYSGTKIKIAANGQIAIACARNMLLANRIADQILIDLVECPIQDRGRRILDTGTRLAMPDRMGAECLIAFAGPEFSLYHFQLPSDGKTYCTTPIDRAVSGDSGSAACFWAERYYSPLLRVDQLVPLAAHIIVSGAKLNSGSIGGLEVVACDKGGFHRWSNEENTQLESCTHDLGARLGQIVIANPRDALSYLP